MKKLFSVALLTVFSSTFSLAVSNNLIEGGSRPKITQLRGGGQCFVYPRYLVFTEPSKNGFGEDIVVYQSPGKTAESQVSAQPTGLNKYMVIKNTNRSGETGGTYFAGLQQNALFVIDKGTSPSGKLDIYDLRTKKKVFGYFFSGATTDKIVRHKFLESEKLVSEVKTLTKAEAKRYPAVKKRLDEGEGFGWFQPVRVDLDTFAESPTGPPVLQSIQ